MSDFIELNRIDPNPYQPRKAHDPEHVQALAESIREQGLLQTPVGRMVDKRVQLAFGHSRLEAFRILSATDLSYAVMPVSVRELTDEEMFQLAVTENSQRRDLTVLETARAMLRYRDEFGKSSAEIGELFGLSDATVRGKIRLLSLPADVLEQVGNTEIPEHTLRELLRLFDIPEDARKRLETFAWMECKPSTVVRDALNGVTAETIAKGIDQMIRQVGADMSNSPFKHDRVFEGDFRSAKCQNCPFRLKSDNRNYCLDEACLKKKEAIAKAEYLAEASAVCGIPPIEDANTSTTDMHTWYGFEKERQIIETRCENLRLVWDNYENKKSVPEFPHAQIACKRRQGQCVCTRALDTGVIAKAEEIRAENAGKSLMEVFKDEENGEVTTSPAPITPTGYTAEQLKQMDREVRAKKRQNLEECRAMREEMIRSVFEGLSSGNPEIVRWLAGNMVTYTRREKLQESPVSELWLAIAEHLVNRLFDWTYSEPSPERTLKEYNQILAKAGIPLLGVSMETEGAK